MVKICPRCKQRKPSADFSVCKAKGDGLQTYCKVCVDKYYTINRERVLARHVQHRKTNRVELNKHIAKKRETKKVKEAGRPKTDACEICGAIGKTVFDHDHKTGLFRGWICAPCNHGLGSFKDNANALMEAGRYLMKRRRA
jgi:Recombination endonuclease VII